MARPLHLDDVAGVHALMLDAFADLDRRRGRPTDPAPDPAIAAVRLRHIITTDPGGSWCTEDADGLTAAALATLREGIWGLSLLVVHPRAQGSGLGRALLERSLAYGAPHRGGIILSSDDDRAMRAYAGAGFRVRPALVAHGAPRRHPAPDGVRALTHEELATTAAVDRVTRGGARPEDVGAMLDAGMQVLALGDRGYVAVADGRVRTLSALDDETARALLRAALATTREGDAATVEFITERNDWAVEVALEAGLALAPYGPVFTRGDVGTFSPYLPSGAYL